MTSKLVGSCNALETSVNDGAEPLTVAAVKRYLRQLKQLENRVDDLFSRQFDQTAVSGGGGDHVAQSRGERSGALEPLSATEPTTMSRPMEDEDDMDSEDFDIFTERAERQVLEFLSGLKIGDAIPHDARLPSQVVVEDLAGEFRQKKEHLKTLSIEELRTLALELHKELIFTLYDAVTLETDLREADEDAATLERAVGEREETIAVLRVQLSTAEDDNVDLHEAKKAALRKLSDAKTEMALLSQRNAKLIKQLSSKEEELQLSLTTSFNGSQRTSAAPLERRDVGTLTMISGVRRDPHHLSVSATGASAGVAVGESSLSFSDGSRLIEVQYALEEIQAELRLARHTLYETEMERIKLQEQLRELREVTRRSYNSNGRFHDVDSSSKDEAYEATLRSTEERCEKAEERAVSLEEELGKLREELQTLKAQAEVKSEVDAAVEQNEVRFSSSNRAATSTDSSSPARRQESRSSSTEPSRTDARLSLSQSRSVSMEAQMLVLQSQLTRAQAKTTHLDRELRREREKTQRQSLLEKKLLENVASLTRQLRAREALEREARSMRRREASTARGDGEGKSSGDTPGSQPRRTYFATARASRGNVSRREESGRGEGDSSINDGEDDGAAGAKREPLRRSEFLAAALQCSPSAEEGRHTGVSESNNNNVAVPTPQPMSKEELRIAVPRRAREIAALPASTAAGSAAQTLALSAKNLPNLHSSFRMDRLSLTNLISPRGPRSSSFCSFARGASADSVQTDGPLHSGADAYVADATPLHRRGSAKDPIPAFRVDDAHGNSKPESTSKHAPTAATLASRYAGSTETASFDLAETPPTRSVQHVSRGQPGSWLSSLARPANNRSSSVGASFHRTSASPFVLSTNNTTTTNNNTTNTTMNPLTMVGSPSSASTVPTTQKGVTIARGLAATVNAPVVALRRRTASRGIVAGRDAKPASSTREGSTALLR